MNINLSLFKKIEEGKNHTTLLHPSGHHLKIAHGGLTTKLKKELDDLPLHKAKGGIMPATESHPRGSKPSKADTTMPGSPANAEKAYTEPDDGGTDIVSLAMNRKAPPFGPMGAQKNHSPPCVNPSCKSYGKPHPNCRCYGGKMGMYGGYAEGGEVESYCDQKKPHEQGCEYYAEGGVAEGEAPGAEPQEPQPVAAPQVNINPNPETQSSQPAAQAPAPQEPAEPDPYQNKKFTDPNYLESIMHDEADKFYSDVDAGHITPKTYADMAGKTSMGKVGTLFGLLIGGAGSGLAGQDNALLKLMNQEINNDLQAQQESQKNRQNLFSINGQNLAQMANAGRIGAETTQMNQAMAKDQANYFYFNQLAKFANSLPAGSEPWVKAQQKLAFLKDAMGKERASGFAQAAGAAAMANQLGGGSNTTLMKSGLLGPEAREVGSDIEEKTIPGVPGRASRPVPQAHRDQVNHMNVLADKAKDLMSYAKAHEGTWDPKTRAIAQQKANELVGFYSSSLGTSMTEGTRTWLDDQIAKKNPTSVIGQELYGSNARLKEIADSNDMRKNTLLKGLGFNVKSSASNEASKTSSGVTSKSGREIEYKNGKAFYK